jgi:hypothetical protein
VERNALSARRTAGGCADPVLMRAAWVAIAVAACTEQPLAVTIRGLPCSDRVFQLPEAEGWVGWNFGVAIADDTGTAPSIERLELVHLSGDREIERLVLGPELVEAHREYDPKFAIVRDLDFRMKQSLFVNAVEVRAFKGRRASAPLRLPIEFYAQKHDYRLPLEGCWYVSSGHDLGREHRRWYNRAHFAWDFVRVDQDGRSFMDEGKTPEDYFGFSQVVVAPADGIVLFTEDRFADNVPGIVGKTEEVNYVLIDHGGEQTKLAHLQRGSVLVKPGAKVFEGQPIGKVGNSGMSDAPHLHLHLQSTTFDDEGRVQDERPLPMSLGRLHLRPKRGEFVCAD